MSDNVNETSNSPRPKFSFFGRASSGEVSREEIIGLNGLESKLGYFAAGIGLVSALLALPNFLKGKATVLHDTQKPSAKHLCASGYHLVTSLCEKQVIQSHAYWTYTFFGLLVMGVLLALASWRRSRAALIVVALVFGLVEGAAGWLFIALAAWLLIRAFRLQKYGDPTFKGSNAVARERGRNRQPRGKAAAPEIGKAAPAPSKRYTPKKKPRR